MQKQVVIIFEPFLSFLLPFQECKSNNMLNMMLDPRFKGLRLVIQYVGKEKAILITNEYDKYVLFPLLVHAYRFLNMFTTSEIVVASTMTNYEMNNFGVKSLYDLMEIDEKMVLSVVKEQMNHYRIRKVSDEECKSPLAW
jgi:hypothetical protein